MAVTSLLLMFFCGVVTAEPDNRGFNGILTDSVHKLESSEIFQYGGDWAGPDLQKFSRSRTSGDIVGSPPSSATGPAASGAPGGSPGAGAPGAGSPGTNPSPAPGSGSGFPIPIPPINIDNSDNDPNPVSVAPPTPQLPARNVGGGVPIQQLFDNGTLIPIWTGQGRVAGEMLELGLTNTSDQPIAIVLEPGMVLALEDEELASAFQPIMLESDKTLLVPANGTLVKNLRGYCLDYSLLPPTANRAFPYRFPADTTAFAPAADVLQNSLSYDAQRNVMPVTQQRTVVIQRAIWASVGQNDKEKLYQDILADAAKAGKVITKKKARSIADVLWKEVERLMSGAQ